jgi:hypothetical protein
MLFMLYKDYRALRVCFRFSFLLFCIFLDYILYSSMVKILGAVEKGELQTCVGCECVLG